MIYLDANIFVHAMIENSAIGNSCRKLMSKIDDGELIAGTSLLTVDEVVWAIKRHVGYKEGIEYGKKILKSSSLSFLPINRSEVLKSFNMMEIGLRPRDALHAATCLNYGIFSILTTDPDFKKVNELDVFSPEEFLKRI